MPTHHRISHRIHNFFFIHSFPKFYFHFIIANQNNNYLHYFIPLFKYFLKQKLNKKFLSQARTYFLYFISFQIYILKKKIYTKTQKFKNFIIYIK